MKAVSRRSQASLCLMALSSDCRAEVHASGKNNCRFVVPHRIWGIYWDNEKSKRKVLFGV